MVVYIRWDCDLDTARGSECLPSYSFQLQERSYNFRCGPTAHLPLCRSSFTCVPVVARTDHSSRILDARWVWEGSWGRRGCPQLQDPQQGLV